MRGWRASLLMSLLPLLTACGAAVAGPSPAPGVFPRGAYTMQHEVGRWNLMFNDDGSFILSVDGDVAIPAGRYAVDRGRIVIDDTVGRCLGASGAYTWTITGAVLTFTVVRDDCDARRSVLHGSRWSR